MPIIEADRAKEINKQSLALLVSILSSARVYSKHVVWRCFGVLPVDDKNSQCSQRDKLILNFVGLRESPVIVDRDLIFKAL